MTTLWIKEWFYNKESEKAQRYMTFFDYAEDNDRGPMGNVIARDGYINIKIQEVLGESEKAIHVIISTGACDGSVKGWKTWIPKSVCKM
ncbi:MAG: hypothetical protein LUE27_05655 [Clostridia bacterium]|nr:hypothetical protein [Clostridia bacterium]